MEFFDNHVNDIRNGKFAPRKAVGRIGRREVIIVVTASARLTPRSFKNTTEEDGNVSK